MPTKTETLNLITFFCCCLFQTVALNLKLKSNLLQRPLTTNIRQQQQIERKQNLNIVISHDNNLMSFIYNNNKKIKIKKINKNRNKISFGLN